MQLKSGHAIIGCYVGASTGIDPTKRELLIGAPLSARDANSEEATPLDTDWQRMAIPGAEIESIAFAYVGEPEEEAPAASKPKVLKWMRANYLRWKVAAPATLALLIAITLV